MSSVFTLKTYSSLEIDIQKLKLIFHESFKRAACAHYK